MEKNNDDQKNVNLIIKSQEEESKSDITISISGIIKNIKRIFALWLAVTILASILSVLIGTFLNIKVYKETSALISFTYDGIERGVDPNGNKFDANSVKTPEIIEEAVTELGMDNADTEKIRSGIVVKSIVPQGVMERITSYKEIVESGSTSSMAAVEKVLETTYYPTQFKVCFNYSDTPYTGDQASELLNKILECYSKYFLKKYGYNETFGNAVKGIDYTKYDYAEVIDVFDTSLVSLRAYLNQLDKADTIMFRSSSGNTFADLIQQIDLIRNTDLDIISSYITLNVVTKDRDSLETYYTYRVEDLQRKEVVCRENLAAINDSISSYEKNTVQIFGVGTDGMSTTATEASKAYDQLFEKRLSAQNELSTTVQKIEMYKSRLERLKTGSTSSNEQKKYVENKLGETGEKIDLLIDDIRSSAEEFYSTYVYSKSYNILVPASSSATHFIKNAIKDSILIVLVIDVLIFVAFFGFAVIKSIVSEYGRTHEVKQSVKKDQKKSIKE